jgi:hypothetical protein
VLVSVGDLDTNRGAVSIGKYHDLCSQVDVS